MPKRKELCYVWRKQRLRPDHDNRCGHLLGSMPICGNRLKRAQALFEMALAALVLITYCANRFYGAWDGVLPEQFCRNHFGDLCGGMLFPAYVNLLCLAVGRRALICGMPTSLVTGVVCSIAWEIAAPMVLSYSVGDPLDAIAYVIGALTHELLRKLFIRGWLT